MPQTAPNWREIFARSQPRCKTSAHTRTFEAIGGVSTLLVPDNTKVAVIKACLYEPQVNRTYAGRATRPTCAVTKRCRLKRSASVMSNSPPCAPRSDR
jgi:hypothetical protein